jgi:ORF6N domain
MAKEQRPVIPVERIVQSILRVRGQKVLLDADLAKLYGVTTKRLNEQVRRNLDRFPEDFLFQLTDAEYADLRSQIATSTGGHGGRRYLPLVFTEHGAIMAASVLNTPLAVEVSIFVVRAFVRLRETLSTNQEVMRKLDQLERKIETHDQAITGILAASATAPALLYFRHPCRHS